jgi:hypothetical protein
MSFGILNSSNVTLDKINDIANFSDPTMFMVKVSNIVYGDILYITLLFTIFIVLYLVAQQVKDSIMTNLTISAAACSVLGFVLRTIQYTYNGELHLLLNDYQLWIFPIITILFTAFIYATRDK